MGDWGEMEAGRGFPYAYIIELKQPHIVAKPGCIVGVWVARQNNFF